jgi:hypothetical protein
MSSKIFSLAGLSGSSYAKKTLLPGQGGESNKKRPQPHGLEPFSCTPLEPKSAVWYAVAVWITWIGPVSEEPVDKIDHVSSIDPTVAIYVSGCHGNRRR